MKNLKRLIALLLSLTLTLGAVGCGAKEGTSEDTQTLTVAVTADDVEVKIMSAFIKAYKEQPGNENKEIKIVKINDNYDSWINKQLYVEQLADIIQIYDYSSEFWTNFELLKPISSYMERDGISEDDYYASVIEMAKSKEGDDSMYWVPRDYNKVVVCYNTKMFELAGIEKPSDDWTFDDFYNTCKKLQAAEEKIKDYTKLTKFWPADMNLNWTATYYPVIKSYGGGLIDKENNAVFENIDAVKKGFSYLMKYADEGLSVTTDDATAPFVNKQCAMMFTSRPNIPEYYDYLEGEIDFVSLPTLSDVETSYIGMGCTGYGITRLCPDEKMELAWDFLKFIISEEGQNAFSKTGSGIPALKSLAGDENATYRTVYEGLNHDAFIKFPERDIPMNYMKGFLPTKQLGIYSYINYNLLSTFIKATGDDREARYQEFKTELEKKFE